MVDQRKKYAVGYALGFAIFSIIAALISLIFILPMLDFDFPMPNVDAAAERNIKIGRAHV